MTTVTVNASKTYDIHIGSGLLASLGMYVKELENVKKVCIVSEDTVFPLWGPKTIDALETATVDVISFVFPAGESSKNGSTFLKLLNFLAAHQLTRSDLIVALGGGVVGDLAGFAASSYLRGIRFLQIPSTLLAMVDSSVGGKTAIDLPAGKNLAGAFYQPCLVLCDTDLLQTLPQDVFRDGCAEVIKYSILYDAELFSYLQKMGLDFDREAVIARCVALKRDVVDLDEFDTGARMKLNLGHTVGHGIEGKSNFSITHGKAVAIGVAIISRSAAALGMCSESCCNQILSILTDFGLPIRTIYSAQELYAYTLSDKKRSASTVRLIIPRTIGSCEIVPIPVDQLKTIIQAGL